jgi:hypothetical protein
MEDLEMRCPRLGGPVNFGYCRREGPDAQPCFKILDCWWQHFDVAAYLESRLPRDVFAALGRRQTPAKMTSLIALIEQAQKNTGKQ